MSRAAAILDATGNVVWASRQALIAFRRGDELSLSVGNLLTISAVEASCVFQRSLRDCLEVLTERTLARHEETELIVVPRSSGPPYVLRVMRLPETLAYDSMLALLLVADPDARSPDLLVVLRTVYSLSPTEARLVQALAEGISLSEFSQSHKMSYETVRSHIRRILHKTGARRQAELVGLYFRLR